MKKFQFRLAVVERHRKLQEQEKQVWLAKCVAKLRATQAKLLDLDKREVQARRDFSALGNPGGRDGASSAKFWMIDQFIQGQKIRRLDLKQIIQIEEQEVAMAYRAFLNARQQRMIMERLREKRFEQHKIERQKAEGRQQDEQYVMRARLSESAPEESHEE
jgi:flagellar export protein FliJ